MLGDSPQSLQQGKGPGALSTNREGEIGAELCRLGDFDQAEKGRKDENNMCKDTRAGWSHMSPCTGEDENN